MSIDDHQEPSFTEILGKADESYADRFEDMGEALGAIAGLPPPPALSERAKEDPTEVPLFGYTDSLGRDIATKISEAEQRLVLLQDDMEAAGKHRDQVVDRTRQIYLDTVTMALRQAEAMTDLVNSNHLQELAILRGRETDILRTLGTLRQAAEALKR